MANVYKITRLDPFVLSKEVGGTIKDNVIEHLAVGCSAMSPDGYGASMDEKVKLPEPNPENFIEFEALCADPTWRNEIASRHIEENNWHAVLDKNIEAKRAQPLRRTFVWDDSGE